ncbi:MAG TPA: nuclear transport factor 2 family protein [Terriglobales bacterium]|nr:nuclear transport factor 2 family protein [Terriglobales bacterium]
MKRLLTSLFVALLLSGLGLARDSTDTRQGLTQMLRTFLDGAAKNDKAAFEHFFAPDVIYTRGVGAVIDRQAILDTLTPPKAGDPVPTYDAEDIVIHESGDVAILNFRLVVHSNEKEKDETAYYRNTGTFQKRKGKWQVIAWQATPIADKKSEGGK